MLLALPNGGSAANQPGSSAEPPGQELRLWIVFPHHIPHKGRSSSGTACNMLIWHGGSCAWASCVLRSDLQTPALATVWIDWKRQHTHIAHDQKLLVRHRLQLHVKQWPMTSSHLHDQ